MGDGCRFSPGSLWGQTRLIATFVLGDLLHIAGVGTLVQSIPELKVMIARQYGTALANSANYPPSILVMFLIALLAGLVAGWSINGLFAFGEEYGWRGFLWERWKHLGVVRANIAIGIVWGLWHAPLILQGFNYPGYPVAGVFMMMVFTTSLAFILSAIRELTQSVIPAAATHGAINGVAGITVLLTAGANPLV
jgi:membrane protease YdiL (CAAX protease family)